MTVMVGEGRPSTPSLAEPGARAGRKDVDGRDKRDHDDQLVAESGRS
jgi:hypothetical protein